MKHMSRQTFGCICLIMSLCLATSYDASAQMPLETRELKLQGATAGSITLRAATTSTPYSLSYPPATGMSGSLLYLSSSDGSLMWSGNPLGDRNIPLWDISANGGNGGVVWTDPSSASNPMWSITGNNLSGIGVLGTTSEQGIHLITNGNVIVSLSSSGSVAINGSSQGGSQTVIGRAGHTTRIIGVLEVDATANMDGQFNINTLAGNANATNINSVGTGLVSIGNSGNELDVNSGVVDVNSSIVSLDVSTGMSLTGQLTINTAGSAETIIGNTSGGAALAGPLKLSGTAGSDGDVLVSQGANAIPQWQSVDAALGIRKAGNVSVANAVSTTAIVATGLTSNDAIMITLQGSGSAVVATVTDRDDVNDVFRVTFSGTYSGVVNYMVIASR